MPKVSICVPNLNTRPFLPERFETIFNQTFQDWELIVYDSYSDDGAWEYIQELAAKEPRMRIFQGPREKTPGCWNPCLREAKGEYVYIATSDDTMMPDCLEKMVAALDANPDCGLCQCELVIIDEKGEPHSQEIQWNHYPLGSYDQNLVSKENKRLAPHDGLLVPALQTIYTSITQLLIRQTVFTKIGMFESRWGPVGDFEWGMRAGLVENCIYIPEKLATWRRHASQATQDTDTPQVRLKMIEMAYAAFARAKACGEASLKKIDINDLVYFLERDFLELSCQLSKSKWQSRRFLMEQLIQRPRAVTDYILDRFQGKKWGSWNSPSRYERLRAILGKYNVPSPIFK